MKQLIIRKLFGFISRRLKKMLIAIFAYATLIDSNRIGLLWRTRSGSNTMALARASETALRAGYSVELIQDSGKRGLVAAIRHVRSIARCRILVGTHGNRKIKKRQRYVELWHGFPLKALGLMEAGITIEAERKVLRQCRNVDFVASYSAMYSTIMNGCFPTIGYKYKITGMPRNDLLHRLDAGQLLRRILSIKGDRDRIVFHMPTYRDRIGSGPGTNGNAFGFKEFDQIRFESFLSENHLYFVHKLHPNDSARMKREGKQPVSSSSRIIFFEDSWLEETGLDLYDCLGGVDILVTDYSSVYFDYLVLDRPIIFCPVDLEIYRAGRNFLFEPYSVWTPGPKVLDQDGLEQQLLLSLTDTRKYHDERSKIREIIHTYTDDRSCNRVWRAILEMEELK